MDRILRLSTWGPLSLARRRLDKHLSYIREDDALLIREDMGAFLTRAELREALEERGLYVSMPCFDDIQITETLSFFRLTEGFTIKQWQSRLRWWLTHINSAESTTNFDHIHERMMLIARSATGRF